MYAFIWRHLPGNVWVKLLLSIVLVMGIVYALFNWIFPWAEPLLPFNDVTVDSGNTAPAVPGGASPAPSAGVTPTATTGATAPGGLGG